MKILKTFENFTRLDHEIANNKEYNELDYYAIQQYIEEVYGIAKVSESDIDEWIVVLKERDEDPTKMTYIEIAESMYEDFEQRSEKDWEENK